MLLKKDGNKVVAAVTILLPEDDKMVSEVIKDIPGDLRYPAEERFAQM